MVTKKNIKPTKKKTAEKKTFSCVIVGTGGQGLITLLEILAKAAEKEGLDAKTSELHGLSQRGGSVEVHIRMGKKVYSPLTPQAKADLIVGLEMQECLKAAYFAGPQTQYLINKNIIPIPGEDLLKEKEIIKDLEKFTSKIEVVDATEICTKELGSGAPAGVYLLAKGVFSGFTPIKPENFWQAVKEAINPRYLEMNEKAIQLAQDDKQ